MVQQKMQIEKKNFIGLMNALIPSTMVSVNCVITAHISPPIKQIQPKADSKGFRLWSSTKKFSMLRRLIIISEVLFGCNASNDDIYQQTYWPKHKSQQ